MVPSAPTLSLSILPLPYTPSPPPYHFPDLSSFLCLKCTMYIVFICNSHLFIVGQPIKTTYSGQAGLNYMVNCDFLFVLSRALQLNKIYEISIRPTYSPINIRPTYTSLSIRPTYTSLSIRLNFTSLSILPNYTHLSIRSTYTPLSIRLNYTPLSIRLTLITPIFPIIHSFDLIRPALIFIASNCFIIHSFNLLSLKM